MTEQLKAERRHRWVKAEATVSENNNWLYCANCLVVKSVKNKLCKAKYE